MRARFRRAANALNLLPLSGDSVAKLDKRRLTRNNRIGAKDFLNRCCALVAVLESMLPARAPKIVLQQNRHASEEPISVGKVRSRGWTGRSNRVLESTR